MPDEDYVKPWKKIKKKFTEKINFTSKKSNPSVNTQ